MFEVQYSELILAVDLIAERIRALNIYMRQVLIATLLNSPLLKSQNLCLKQKTCYRTGGRR